MHLASGTSCPGDFTARFIHGLHRPGCPSMRKADQNWGVVLMLRDLQKSPSFSQPFSPLSRHVAIQEIGPKKKKKLLLHI